MAKITIEADPLPTNFAGTPQEFLEALVDRLRISLDQVGFVISDTQPTSNEGPWLKDGKQIWVWDEGQSSYVPLDVSASVREQIWIGSTAPPIESGSTTEPAYKLWLRLQGNEVLGLYYWVGGSIGWATRSELKPGVITSEYLATNSVQTQHLANQSVTPAKLVNPLNLSSLNVILPGSATPLSSVKVFRIKDRPDTWKTYDLTLEVSALGGFTQLPFFVDLWLEVVEDVTISASTAASGQLISGSENKFAAGTRIHWTCAFRYVGTGWASFFNGNRGIASPAFYLRTFMAGPNQPRIRILRHPFWTGGEGTGVTEPVCWTMITLPTTVSGGAADWCYARIPMSKLELIVTAAWGSAPEIAVDTDSGGQSV